MKNLATYSLLIYAILLIAGGYMGYLKARSQASLIAGGVFGALSLCLFGLGLAGWPFTSLCGLILAVVVLIAMSRRAMTKGVVGPAGFVMFLSFAVIAVADHCLGQRGIIFPVRVDLIFDFPTFLVRLGECSYLVED